MLGDQLPEVGQFLQQPGEEEVVVRVVGQQVEPQCLNDAFLQLLHQRHVHQAWAIWRGRGQREKEGACEEGGFNFFKCSLFAHLNVIFHPMSVTSAADNGSHKEGQVAVIQLQGVEACGKLEFGLHHVAKWPPEALKELSGDEASTAGHEEAVFVHAGGQEGEEGFVNAVLQESHLNGQVKRPQHDSNVLRNALFNSS